MKFVVFSSVAKEIPQYGIISEKRSYNTNKNVNSNRYKDRINGKYMYLQTDGEKVAILHPIPCVQWMTSEGQIVPPIY